MASQPGVFNLQAFTDSGAPAAGYRLYTLVQGTTAHKAAFTDAAGLVAHTYTSDGSGGLYIALNSRGELPAPLFLASGAYDIALKTPLGATVWTRYAAGDAAGALSDALESGASASSGAGLVGFNPAMSYSGQTVGRALLAFGMPLSQFGGADPTGIADSTAAINAAFATQAINGLPIIVDGRFRHTSALILSTFGARLVGVGGLTESASSSYRSASCLIKDFNGQGITFAGDCQVTDGVQYDSTAGKTGDNVQVTGSRWNAPNICVTNAGRDGVRINADAGSYNTNLWHIGRIITRSNGRHGLHLNDPVGSTDAGGGVCLFADMIGNGGDGIKCDNCTWNTFVCAVSQNNTGVGFRITANARAITVLGGDLEGNSGGAQGLLEPGTFSHTVTGAFYGNPQCWTDASGLPGRNIVAFYDPNIGASVTCSAANVTNYQVGGNSDVNLYADVNADLVATMRGTKVGTSGGKLTLRTKIDGGLTADRMTIDQIGIISMLGGRADKHVVLTYGTTVALDAAAGNRFQINANSGAAWALSTPTNASTGQPITICVRNTSGGAVGAITWPAEFKMAAWTSPGNGFSRSITLRYDGQFWIEESRTPADIPN